MTKEIQLILPLEWEVPNTLPLDQPNVTQPILAAMAQLMLQILHADEEQEGKNDR